MSLAVFYLLSGVILLCGLMVVTLRNVFHSALFLVLTFFLVAGIYLTLDAEFIAAVQVLIYVGAVTILILFAIMLTHQIQSKALRQVNEQVIPALIISILLFGLSAFALAKTFGDKTARKQMGAWTASLDISKLPPSDTRWNWTIDIQDKNDHSYIAGGSFGVSDREGSGDGSPVTAETNGSGYVISSQPDYTTMNRLFQTGQTAYIKAWSDKIDYSSVNKAVWKIAGIEGTERVINLTNSNTETIGRLLMSKFVLPFEVVSVLLLAALIGAIVVARKDE